MHINQFSILPSSPEEQEKELSMLGLLKDDELSRFDSTQLWLTFLTRIYTSSEEEIAVKQWLHDLLATPKLAIDDWIKENQPLTTDVFYLVALQLLGFEPGIDFDLTKPVKIWKKIGLPILETKNWSSNDVLSAFYLLLNTRGKNGQIFLDQLTSQGFLTWTYDLPAKDKPLFFNGKPIASFDSTKFIREVIYIETDMDTDYDGQADLVKAEIMRPADTNAGLKVPVIFTASPYNQGTNDEWGEKVTHDVNRPLRHKETAPAVAEPTFPKEFSHQKINGESKTATETFSSTPTYTLNNYLAARGYAVVYSAGIGTKDSDGLQTCGSPEQTNSMKAVVEWLHGDRIAFTDRHSGIQIKAWWCNGNIAMTGRSYLGTLATAVATTGVPGLKAIISEAAISSWYDYYRENGLVRAPGGFQGEDADVLADETFSRTKRPADYQRIKPTNDRYIKGLVAAMDRKTGNYNDFWAVRNYRPAIKDIQADVMMVHGLNDTNVRVSNVKALYDGLQSLPITSKLILHQGQHIYINAFQSLDFSEMVNLWLANKLWGQHNNADDILPDLLVQNNAKAEEWNTYTSWENGNEEKLHFDQGHLTKQSTSSTATISFNDHQDEETFKTWCKDTDKWQVALTKDKGTFSYQLKTLPTKDDFLLRGTPKVSLTVSSSVDHGLISAQLVDLGDDHRLKVSPTILNRSGLELGFHWATDDLREFELQKEKSSFKVISSGHINLQNRVNSRQVDPLAANEFVSLHFCLQPIFHQLKAGHQLALIIYSTDFAATLRGNEAITYSIQDNSGSLFIPTITKL
ncbi:Xaa-Pro dipeptidyl-peptidase [Lactobacillaceae bacterium 24-114]